MKPICFFGLLFVLGYTSLMAQKIELGVNYGSNCAATLHGKGKIEIPAEHKRVKTSLVLNFKASYNTDKWQIGATLGVSSISGRAGYYNGNHMVIICRWASSPYIETPEMLYDLENPPYKISYIPYTAFVNRKVNMARFALYVGVSFGGSKILKVEGGQSDVTDGHYGLRLNYYGGVQAGCKYAVGKHLGINTELAAHYMNLHHNLFVLSFPLTTGVSYSFE